MRTALFIVVAALLQTAPTARYTISGRVQTVAGSAASAVRVAAVPAPRENVRAADGQNYYPTQQPVSVTVTDANGRYQLGNIAPGRYVLIAGLVRAGTYLPAATDIDEARVLTVDASNIADADITLLTFPGARVSGRITPPPAADIQEWAGLAGVTLGELLEVPLRADGTFEFGRVPPGDYSLTISPTPPGHTSVRFSVTDQDVTGIDIVRPPVRRVRGRVAVQRGPLPTPLLAFVTAQSYVPVSLNADNTFDVAVHAGRHRVEVGGLPAGYALNAVRVGTADVTNSGVVVAATDVSDVVVEVTAPRELPMLRGRVTGSLERGGRVAATGRIVGAVEAPIGTDGTFAIGPLPPGLYTVRLVQREDIPPVQVVVDSRGGDVMLPAPPRTQR